MKIKRHKFKCSVPGCKNTDTIVLGKHNYFDNGCIHLCDECAKAYAKAWSDEKSKEKQAAEAKKTEAKPDKAKSEKGEA